MLQYSSKTGLLPQQYQNTAVCVAVLQDYVSAPGLHALLQQQSLLRSNPALAILLAANSQGRWHEGMLPTDVPIGPEDHVQSAALASNMAACCHPYMHMEEAAIACQAMTVADLALPFTPQGVVPNYLNAGIMDPSMAQEPWPGLMTDGLYEPSVPPQTDTVSYLHSEGPLAQSFGNFLASGPQRNKHVRDTRSTRHSPY